eukprot:1544504-Alexandrium_andersonii.AAC.1
MRRTSGLTAPRLWLEQLWLVSAPPERELRPGDLRFGLWSRRETTFRSEFRSDLGARLQELRVPLGLLRSVVAGTSSSVLISPECDCRGLGLRSGLSGAGLHEPRV